MKRVLITGANSYVGTNVERWLMKEPDKYYVETLDMKDPNWRNFDFSRFDVVFHVAGIAHVSTRKSLDDMYYKVNRDLAIDTADKAKISGVKQFVFMSSMIIYGEDNATSEKHHIDINEYKPTNAYGKSKLEADLAIQKMQSNTFRVSIVRTPVIYGPNCKGNFPRLQKIASLLFIVPNIYNQRSMIYIDNFSEFIKQLLIKSSAGVYYPQNSEYLSTSHIIAVTRRHLGKRTFKTRVFNPIIVLMSKCFKSFRRVFGNKTYNLNISNPDYNYHIVGNEESIIRSISF